MCPRGDGLSGSSVGWGFSRQRGGYSKIRSDSRISQTPLRRGSLNLSLESCFTCPTVRVLRRSPVYRPAPYSGPAVTASPRASPNPSRPGTTAAPCRPESHPWPARTPGIPARLQAGPAPALCPVAANSGAPSLRRPLPVGPRRSASVALRPASWFDTRPGYRPLGWRARLRARR